MDWRPCRDDKLVFDADPLDFFSHGPSGRVHRKSLDFGLCFRRGFLKRAQQPLVTLAGRARQHFVGALQFLFGLLFLKLVDIEPSFFHIVYNGAPGERHAGGVVQARQRAVIGGKEEKAVPAMAGLGSVVPHPFQNSLERGARFLPRIPFLGRQDDHAQGRIVRNVAMRRKHVDAIEECRVPRPQLQNIGDFSAHFGFFIEAAFAVFHFAAQVGACVEPEPRCILRLVAGTVQVVQPVRQPVEGIRIHRRCLAGLQASKNDARTVDAPYADLGSDR